MSSIEQYLCFFSLLCQYALAKIPHGTSSASLLLYAQSEILLTSEDLRVKHLGKMSEDIVFQVLMTQDRIWLNYGKALPKLSQL